MLILILVAACGGSGAGSPTPTPAESESAAASASTAASAGESAAPSDPSTGPASLEAPDEVEAGTPFDVTFTGPNGRGDYVTIVLAGSTEWTGGDPYFDTANGSPGTLVAPTKAGAYELWYVQGSDDAILARRDITLTPFTGDLAAPAEVEGWHDFEVAWNGPDAQGDFITIVPEGAAAWTNADDYFYTYEGNPGTLRAPVVAGAYEIWYVAGSDDTVFARLPITVTEIQVSLSAPPQVPAGGTFEVEWTGPDINGDYITIVPTGSDPGRFLDYFYTYEGNPGTLTAPDEAGNYEIWYVADDQGYPNLEVIPIVVT
jgi:Ca-activated chloride channel family protein